LSLTPKFVLYDNRPHLFDLIWFCLGSPRLEIQQFNDAFLEKDVMSTSNPFKEAQTSQ